MRARNNYFVVNTFTILAIIVALFAAAPRASAQASCTLRSTSPSVTICTPANNATGLTSPVHVNAGATDTGHTIKLMQIFVDGVGVTNVANQSWIDKSVAMSTGTRRLTVQATDDANTLFRTTVYVTVGGTTPSTGG